MAEEAGLRGGFEIFEGAGIDMTLQTLDLGVLPGQRESCTVVVEIVTIGVHPIMTGKAVTPEI
jgi:hypothetical protein